MTQFFKNFLKRTGKHGEKANKKGENSIPKGPEHFPGSQFPEKTAGQQPGNAPQPQVAPADAEGKVYPSYGCREKKQQVSQVAVLAAQGPQHAVPQPQPHAHQAGREKAACSQFRRGHFSSRWSQPPLGRGSS